MRIFSIMAAVAGASALLPAEALRAQDERGFCPDRPGLGTPACTLDRGRFAAELGVIDWTVDRENSARADLVTGGDLLLRYGLTGSLEVQAGWTLFGHSRLRSGGAVEASSGVGDVLIGLRQNLHNSDGSGLAVAIMPYATLPTGGATLGAGDWGAGVIVPLSYELPQGFALGFTATVEAAVDGDRDGRHLAYGGIVGLDLPLSDRIGATVEIAARRDRDPEGSTTEWLAGVSAGWSPREDLQLDAGANIGLSRAAPDLQLYAGIAKLF
jgi:hypothetical protein